MSVVIMYVTCTYAFSHCKKWFRIKLSFAEKSTLRNFLKEVRRRLIGHEVGGDFKWVLRTYRAGGQGEWVLRCVPSNRWSQDKWGLWEAASVGRWWMMLRGQGEWAMWVGNAESGKTVASWAYRCAEQEVYLMNTPPHIPTPLVRKLGSWEVDLPLITATASCRTEI